MIYFASKYALTHIPGTTGVLHRASRRLGQPTNKHTPLAAMESTTSNLLLMRYDGRDADTLQRLHDIFGLH